MASMSSANYFDDVIDAFEVDDNHNQYDKDMFRCINCKVKIQFTSGTDKTGPYFRNWQKIEHADNCTVSLNYNKYKTSNNNHNENIFVVTSMILPRSTRLKEIKKEINCSNKKGILINRYFGKRSKIFLSALTSLSENEMQNLALTTEDGDTVKLSEIILCQDRIIERLEKENAPFICILKGYTTHAMEVKGNIKIPLTYNGNYGNKNKFDLFIPYSYRTKNEDRIKNIERCLIYCYGYAEKNQYGYKMDVYSIAHQIAPIPYKKTNNNCGTGSGNYCK